MAFANVRLYSLVDWFGSMCNVFLGGLFRNDLTCLELSSCISSTYLTKIHIESMITQNLKKLNLLPAKRKFPSDI
jgi:hypothetical protein